MNLDRKKYVKEFRELTKQLLSSYGLDIKTLNNLFKLDQPVFDMWYTAYEVFEQAPEKGRQIMAMLISHKSISTIDKYIMEG